MTLLLTAQQTALTLEYLCSFSLYPGPMRMMGLHGGTSVSQLRNPGARGQHFFQQAANIVVNNLHLLHLSLGGAVPCCGNFDLLCCLCDLLQESTQYQDMDKLCRLSHSTRTCRDTQAHGGWPYPIEPVLVEIIFRCSQRRIAVFYLTLLSSYCVLGPAQFLLSSLVCFL